MRFIAAINTRFYGVDYSQGSEVNTTAWTRKQLLQFLGKGLIQASQITAGAIQDALVFVGPGVSTSVDAEGRLVVTIETEPQSIDWLTDVDTTERPDGSALLWDEAEQLWKPGVIDVTGSSIALATLADVEVAGAADGATLVYEALTGTWVDGPPLVFTLATLADVDIEGILDGQTVVWDNSAAMFVPGTPLGEPGPAGPVTWATPVPWTTSLVAITGPPATVVTYNGSAYVAIANSVNVLPTNTSFWRLIVSKGEQGIQGDTGPASTVPGPPGDDGVDGTDGVGVPVGGSAGQALVKVSGTDYDTMWADVIASGGGSGLFRGEWAALQLLYAPNLTAGIPAEMTTDGTWTIVSDNYLTPGFGNVPMLKNDQLANTGNHDLSFTAPPDATQLNVWVLVAGGGSGSGVAVLNNGSYTYGPAFQLSWLKVTRTIAGGDVVTLRSLTAPAMFTHSRFGGIEVYGTPEPYMTGEYVVYSGRLWRSNYDDNTQTPGVSGWTEYQLTIDPVDITGSTTVGRAVLTAVDASAARAAIGAGSTDPDYKGVWNPATTYQVGDLVVASSALWAALSSHSNIVPSSARSYSSAGSDNASALLQSGQFQYIHKFKLSADTLLGAVQFATVAPGYLTDAVTWYLTTQIQTSGSTVDPSQLTPAKTVVPAEGGATSNIYWNRLYLDDPITLTAGVEYALVISSASSFAGRIALNPTPTYTGVMVAPTTTAEDLYRSTLGGAWVVQDASRRIPVSILSTAAVTWERIATEVDQVTHSDSQSYSITGMLAATAGTHKLYNDSGRTRTITKARASVGTAPAGAGIVVDVNLNGTTAFTSKPTIAAAATTGTAVPSTAAWPDGAYLTVDVDSVGTTTPGADLVVTISYTE